MRDNSKPSALIAVIATILVTGVLVRGAHWWPFSSSGSMSGRVAGTQTVFLLSTPQHLQGDKAITSARWQLDRSFLSTHNTLTISYNLHGLCLLDGKASEIAIVSQSSAEHSAVSLASYGKNCFEGQQEVAIPLSHFSSLPGSASAFAWLQLSFWYPTTYRVDIDQISLGTSDTEVLGAAIAPSRTKPFSDITPIRPEPYAKTNASEANDEKD